MRHWAYTEEANVCQRCGFSTCSVATFQRHRKHCGALEVAPVEPVQASSSKSAKKSSLVCSQCLFSASSKEEFLVHQKQVHDGPKIKCTSCDFVCKSRSALHRHRKKFPSHNPFKNGKKIGTNDRDGAAQDAPTTKEMDVVSKKPVALNGKTAASNGEMTTNNSVLSPPAPKKVTKQTQDSKKNLAANVKKSVPIANSAKVTASKLAGKSGKKLKKNGILAKSKKIDKIYNCDKCDFVATSKTLWMVHRSEHDDVTVYSCTECRYKTSFRKNFERHEWCHIEDGPYRCSICSYSSSGENAVRRHISMYHPAESDESPSPESKSEEIDSPVPKLQKKGKKLAPKKPSSPILDTVLEAEVSVEMKRKNDGSIQWTCLVCSAKYGMRRKINRHMKDKHLKNLQQCTIVEKSEELEIMSEAESVEQESPEPLIGNESSPIPGDVDSEDDKNSDSTHSLTETNSQEKLYSCAHCSYTAARLIDMRRHLSRAAENNFNCCKRKRDKAELGNESKTNKRLKIDEEPTILQQLLLNKNPTQAYSTLGNSDKDDLKSKKKLVKIKKLKKLQDIIVKPVKKKKKEVSLTKASVSSAAKNEEDTFVAPEDEDSPGQIAATNMSSDGYSDGNSEPESYRDKDVEYLQSLMCNTCGYVGKIPSEVRQHNKIHTGEKNYWCTLCSYKTIWKGDMKRHLENSHAAKPKTFRRLLYDCFRPDGIHTAEQLGIPMLKKIEPSKKSSLDIPKLLDKTTKTVTELKNLVEIPGNKKKKKIKTVSAMLKAKSNSKINEQQKVVNAEALEAKTLENESVLSSSSSSTAELVFRVDDVANSTLDSEPRSESKLLEKCRPYKCSECDKRSNWKWDIKRHISTDHPSAVIVKLNDVEARQTFLEIVRNHQERKHLTGKLVNRKRLRIVSRRKTGAQSTKQMPRPLGQKPHPFLQEAPLNSSTPLKEIPLVPSTSKIESKTLVSILPKPIQVVNLLSTKVSPVIKSPVKEKVVIQINTDVSSILLTEIPELKPRSLPVSTLSAVPAVAPVSVSLVRSPLPVSLKSPPPLPLSPLKTLPSKGVAGSAISPKKRLSMKVDHSKLKRFKCSACPYRSNFHGDIARHLKVRHMNKNCNVTLMSSDVAAATLPSYSYNPNLQRSAKKEIGEDAGIDSNSVASTASRSSTASKTFVENHARAVNDHDGRVRNSRILADGDEMKRCNICPYVTDKADLLKLHMSYHQPQPRNSYSCHYCPFFVNTSRMFHHHMLLHTPKDSTELPPLEVFHRPIPKNLTAKYVCDQCPFSSIERSYYWSHRKFHFEKENSFKCSSCPFWAPEKRILAQHNKLHALIYFPKLHFHASDVIAPGNDCRCVFAMTYKGSYSTSLQCYREMQCMYCSYKVASVTLMRQHSVFHVSFTDAVRTSLFSKSLDNADSYLDVTCCQQNSFNMGDEGNLLKLSKFDECEANCYPEDAFDADGIPILEMVTDMPSVACDDVSSTDPAELDFIPLGKDLKSSACWDCTPQSMSSFKSNTPLEHAVISSRLSFNETVSLGNDISDAVDVSCSDVTITETNTVSATPSDLELNDSQQQLHKELILSNGKPSVECEDEQSLLEENQMAASTGPNFESHVQELPQFHSSVQSEAEPSTKSESNNSALDDRNDCSSEHLLQNFSSEMNSREASVGSCLTEKINNFLLVDRYENNEKNEGITSDVEDRWKSEFMRRLGLC